MFFRYSFIRFVTLEHQIQGTFFIGLTRELLLLLKKNFKEMGLN